MSRHIRSRLPVLALATLLLACAAFSAQAADCTSAAWDPATAYSRGDPVTWAFHEWKAKRNTTGVEPGTHNPTWADLGACGGEPPPPPPPPSGGSTPMQIFGLWHAGDHYADWAFPRDASPDGEFDRANHWIIDGGNGKPAVNLVVLSFLHPLDVLDMTGHSPEAGVPLGMSMDVVNYFKAAGIRVMMSIGGITYTDFWDQALTADAWQMGLNAAAIASHFGVGIEIDYERNVGANLVGLGEFIAAYRSVHPYDATGANPAARLTIDLAAGDRYLQELTRHATLYWLDNDAPVLDYANAMVARSSGTPVNWQEHVDGKPQYDPPIPPLAPNRFTGGLYLKGDTANCLDFAASEQYAHADYVESVAPNVAGTTPGMLGYMFWAAEYPSARRSYVGTVPPNSCEGGMGVASEVFEIPLPMPALRQE